MVLRLERPVDDCREIQWRLRVALVGCWRGRRTGFQQTYPSLYARFKPMEDALRKRQDKGKHWWELRACAYWDRLRRAEDRLSGDPVPSVLRVRQIGVLRQQQDILHSVVRPLLAGGSEFAAILVAQLAIPAAHEGRGVVAGRLPDGIPADRTAQRPDPFADGGRSRTDHRDHREPAGHARA